MTVCAATNNPGKLKELRRILEKAGHTVKSLRELGITLDPEETGATFAENARIKAAAFCAASGLPTVADDSGLCVDALGGAPGIYSARYAGEHGNDKKNRALLLKNLENASDRAAYFECAAALAFPGGETLVATGKTYGSILTEERGEGGFGYDPVFFSDDLQKSFGEAAAAEKNAVSHRFRALTALKELAGGDMA